MTFSSEDCLVSSFSSLNHEYAIKNMWYKPSQKSQNQQRNSKDSIIIDCNINLWFRIGKHKKEKLGNNIFLINFLRFISMEPFTTFWKCIIFDGIHCNYKFFIMSMEFDKNISDWRHYCTDYKNDLDFFLRLAKWPKIAVKKSQIFQKF